MSKGNISEARETIIFRDNMQNIRLTPIFTLLLPFSKFGLLKIHFAGFYRPEGVHGIEINTDEPFKCT